MTLDLALTAFATLFVVIDPIGLAPIFVALTQGMTQSERLKIAVRACLISVIVLTVFGLVGEALLATIGISMPAFRIAGGLLLFLTAIDMLFEKRTDRRETRADAPPPDPSVFPLATPLIAGPGALAAMILLTGSGSAGSGGTGADLAGSGSASLGGADWALVAGIHGVMIGVVGLVFILFLAAGLLERLLGPTGTRVVTRLLGMLLAALSVQFVLDGLGELGVVRLG